LVSFDVSPVAVVVAGILAMVLGFIWYGPLFGKKWMKLSGKTMKDMEAAKGKMPALYFFGFIAALITAFILGVLISSLGVTQLGDALVVGVLVWLGFDVTLLLGGILWEGMSKELFVLNAAHQLVNLLVMSAVFVYL